MFELSLNYVELSLILLIWCVISDFSIGNIHRLRLNVHKTLRRNLLATLVCDPYAAYHYSRGRRLRRRELETQVSLLKLCRGEKTTLEKQHFLYRL